DAVYKVLQRRGVIDRRRRGRSHFFVSKSTFLKKNCDPEVFVESHISTVVQLSLLSHHNFEYSANSRGSRSRTLPTLYGDSQSQLRCGTDGHTYSNISELKCQNSCKKSRLRTSTRVFRVRFESVKFEYSSFFEYSQCIQVLSLWRPIRARVALIRGNAECVCLACFSCCSPIERLPARNLRSARPLAIINKLRNCHISYNRESFSKLRVLLTRCAINAAKASFGPWCAVNASFRYWRARLNASFLDTGCAKTIIVYITTYGASKKQFLKIKNILTLRVCVHGHHNDGKQRRQTEK
ncbi:unnamed protein product, partial [Trichogramma brassicae]